MAADTFALSAPPSWSARLRLANFWHWGLLALVAVLVGLPLTFLVIGSFSQSHLPTELSLANLTLRNYRAVWGDPETWKLFYNTGIYAFGATVFGLSVAATLAWLVERTNIPGKTWIYAGVPMTLAMPGMLQAMAYVLLLSPRIGFLNKALEGIGLDPINIYSIGGMIFVEGLRLVPTAFLMLVPLLRSHGSGAGGGSRHVGREFPVHHAQSHDAAVAARAARGRDLSAGERAGSVRGARHSRHARRHLRVLHQDLCGQPFLGDRCRPMARPTRWR